MKGGEEKALFCARPNFPAAKKRNKYQTCGKPYGNACYASYGPSSLEIAGYLLVGPNKTIFLSKIIQLGA